MREVVAIPSAMIARILVLTSTISDIRTVRSSSVLDTSWPTDGLRVTGGTGSAVHTGC